MTEIQMTNPLEDVSATASRQSTEGSLYGGALAERLFSFGNSWKAVVSGRDMNSPLKQEQARITDMLGSITLCCNETPVRPAVSLLIIDLKVEAPYL